MNNVESDSLKSFCDDPVQEYHRFSKPRGIRPDFIHHFYFNSSSHLFSEVNDRSTSPQFSLLHKLTENDKRARKSGDQA